MGKTIMFGGYECYLRLDNYSDNNNTAIMLVDKFDYECVAMVTVNLNSKLPEDRAYIKNYSENTGILEVLIKKNIVKDIEGYVQEGYVTIPRVILNMELLKKISI